MRMYYPKLRSLAHALSLSVFIAFEGTNLIFLFAITAAGVLQGGGPKMSSRSSSIVQILF